MINVLNGFNVLLKCFFNITGVNASIMTTVDEIIHMDDKFVT